MIIYRIDANRIDEEAIKRAASALQQGGLVIFPTETVYGLAANPFDQDAVMRVFEAKRREPTTALPIQIGDKNDIAKVAHSVSKAGKRLIERFFPGPLTLILLRHPDVPAIVSGGKDTIGIRMPNHPVALRLIWAFGGPIVATSANFSGELEPKSAADAVLQLGQSVDIALDSGRSLIGKASTVVDMTENPIKILREGSISAAEIAETAEEEIRL